MTEPDGSGKLSGREAAFAALAGGLAHELTNVLSAALMLVDLLSGASSVAPRDQGLLAAVGESSRRGVDLVRQLLWLARGREETATLFQPRHLLVDVEKMVRATVQPAITLSSEIPGDLWLLRSDPFQLYCGLLALCRAASSQLSVGRLVLGARNYWVDDVAAALRPGLSAGPHLVVEVASGGQRGVFPDEASTLFASIGAFPEIVTAGDSQVFRLYLAAQPPATTASPVEEKILEAGNGELVLIAESDDTVRQAMASVLEQHSYRPLAAADGAEAIALFAQRAPAAVVVGMGLTFLDAPGVVRVIRRLQEGAPVLATGTEEELAGWPADLSVHPQAVLAKPFASAGFLSALRQILRDEALSP